MRKYCHRLFARWASLGRTLSQGETNWNHTKNFGRAGLSYLREKEETHKKLLKKSQRRFRPLSDPFSVDLGLHKWLSDAREEAYSSWLAWILAQLRRSEDVEKIFTVTLKNSYHGKIVCKLEEWVDEGHVGHGGRVDILVRFGDVPALVIEVKVGDADYDDTGKQTGYAKSFGKSVQKILLARSGEKGKYEGGFILRRWDQICINLRRLIPELELNHMQKALTLAFVGAVEQNIAGLSDKTKQIELGMRSEQAF